LSDQSKPFIQLATPSDIPLIRELCFQVWPQTYASILGTNQVAYMLDLFYAPDKLLAQMEEPGHRFIICNTEDEPSAFASYSEIGPHIFKLHKIYIIPQRQGRGIGKLMISYILEDIKANGGKALRLNVNRYNYSALAFYNKMGFKLYAEEDIDIGGGYFMNDFVLNLDVV
jgi:ribosomal protein S18 acetylase RimI-like enzyme